MGLPEARHALFLDFDGTLVDIAPRPDAVRVREGLAATLQRLAARVATARLQGRVRLQPPEPGEQRFCATLTALEGNQSCIEEHFADEDLLHLADAVELALDTRYSELEFRIEELGERFSSPIRTALQQAGVVLDDEDRRAPAKSQPDATASSE